VYGGRVHANQKYVKKVIEEKIADYDGVSLYPSAINRLCRESGLATGPCVAFKSDVNLTDFNYFIVTIKINKVQKMQDMPMLAVKTANALIYSNDIPTEDITIDKYTLEDYIKFHQIEYEIVEGIGWSEKRGNKKMGELIQTLFQKRMGNKKSNPALANILKLMLNSSYGKTIMKKSKTKCRIVQFDKEEIKNDSSVIKHTYGLRGNYIKFINKHFNTIKYVRHINDKIFEVEQLTIDASYNRGHIGCAILSMSKRIMNEVFDTANTIKAPIYYTDTDSIHMNYKDVPRLEQAFREEYKRELTGFGLEQFHIDFELQGATSEVFAVKSLFLGKKSYIDKLQSIDRNGNVINGYHIRLKGITKESIEHHCKEYNNPFEMFEELATGVSKEMTLNPFNSDNNSQKVLFEFLKGSVRTRSEFKRVIKF
jgi:hypothetical protein